MQNFDHETDWERTAILELQREYEYVCRVHKVKLRAIVITISDSTSHWGEFNSATRTISISRKLLSEHAWHHVVGVLRHEMAHQYVAELEPRKFSNERPHSETFKDACQRLGVSDQYARAGLDLQSCDLDWRHQPIAFASERILDKVKKLLTLANSSNENEALLAMERVRELYAKYNLERLSFEKQSNFVHLVICHNKKRLEAWERRILSVLIEHFFVQVLTLQQYHVQSGERFQAIEIIGLRENVGMAEYVYHFLRNQIQLLVQDNLRKGVELSRSDRASFKLGVLDGFAIKLKNAEKSKDSSPIFFKSHSQTRSLSLVGRALSNFHERSGLDGYVGQMYPSLRTGRRSSVNLSYGAFAAGHAAGKSLTLNKPIETKRENKGRLLNGQ